MDHDADLAVAHAVVVREEEPGLFGIGIEPSVAIGQRALLVQTTSGNVLWDCIPLLDDFLGRLRIAQLGGIAAIRMFTPTSMGPTLNLPRLSTRRSSSPKPTPPGFVARPSAWSCSTKKCPHFPELDAGADRAATSTRSPCCIGRPGPTGAASSLPVTRCRSYLIEAG